MSSAATSVDELTGRRDYTIADLERTVAEKDVQIRELLSQLDKYRCILQLAGLVGGTPPLQQTNYNGSSVSSRKLQRAWGISAEPQSSIGGDRCDLRAASLAQSYQKFFKDQV